MAISDTIKRIRCNPELSADAKRERIEALRERDRAYRREYMAKRLADPAYRAAWNEKERLRAAAKRGQETDAYRAMMAERAERMDVKRRARNEREQAKRDAERERLRTQTDLNDPFAAKRAAASPELDEADVDAKLTHLRELHTYRASVLAELSELTLRAGVGLAGAKDTRAARARLEREAQSLVEPIAAAREALGLPREIRADAGAEGSAAQRAQLERARKNSARNAARRKESAGS